MNALFVPTLTSKKTIKNIRTGQNPNTTGAKSTKNSPQFANEALPTSRQISGINGDEVI